MKLFLILLLCLPVFAVEEDVAKISRMVKLRKEQLKAFREKVSKGDTCRVRDYDCFSREVLTLVQGHPEDLIEVKSILEPFYERSLKEGFPPCSDTCQHTALASHLKLFMDYLLKYDLQQDIRLPAYPTVSSVRIRSYMDLSAMKNLESNVQHWAKLYKNLNLGKVTRPELTNKKVFEAMLAKIEERKFFSNSILCHLQTGDPIFFDLTHGSMFSGKSIDDSYTEWLTTFQKNYLPNCNDTTPLIYRGTDRATRKFYRDRRDEKLSMIYCEPGDFGCFRKIIREVGIHYTEDVEKVAGKLIAFLKKSRVKPCDETCQAQSLVKMIQTWITYLSTYERDKLASTMDWNEFPQARYDTITEDVEMYRSLKRILSPIITTYGKIDPQNIKDPGLRSELRSVAKDLSDFASARMLKDSVICTMEPWSAAYDRYLSPYKDKAKDKKFEEALIEFKSNVCK